MELFRKAVRGQRDLRMAYITGRNLNRTLDALEKWNAPIPHILAPDAGTSLFIKHGKLWKRDALFMDKMRAAWRDMNAQGIHELLGDIPDVELREQDRQGDYRLSYYAPISKDPKSLVQNVKRRLSRQRISANLIISTNEKKGNYMLDIMPPSGGKDFVIHYLKRSLRIDKKHVIYAGNSANDLIAFTSGHKSIVVANTPARVKQVLSVYTQKNDKPERIYFAAGEYIKGVHEGCEHFGIL